MNLPEIPIRKAIVVVHSTNTGIPAPYLALQVWVDPKSYPVQSQCVEFLESLRGKIEDLYRFICLSEVTVLFDFEAKDVF